MSISNNPPAYEAISLHIEDLIAEAHNFLDGEPIKAQGQADAVGTLLDMIRQAKKAADEQRVIEKKPHADAAKAFQTKSKPLIRSDEHTSELMYLMRISYALFCLNTKTHTEHA